MKYALRQGFSNPVPEVNSTADVHPALYSGTNSDLENKASGLSGQSINYQGEKTSRPPDLDRNTPGLGNAASSVEENGKGGTTRDWCVSGRGVRG